MASEKWFFEVASHNCGIEGPATTVLLDGDQRRYFTVTMEIPEIIDGDRDGQWDRTWDQSVSLIQKHAKELGPDVMSLTVEENGTITTSTNEDEDATRCPYFPRIVDVKIPGKYVKTVLRSDLVELRRVMTRIDIVRDLGSDGTRKFVLKTAPLEQSFHELWTEIHIGLHLPPHPNILPIDRVVLEEVTGQGVVGFTTAFMPNGDLDSRRDTDLLFKMKWLKQLMKVVDDVNLQFGIVHQDISGRNILHDGETDDILLFDFGLAAKLGHFPTWPPIVPIKDKDVAGPRNDVKGVMFTVYDIITRDPATKDFRLHVVDEADITDAEKWVKHPQVQLDAGLTALDYYNELMAWVGTRRPSEGGWMVKCHCQAPKHFSFPDDPPPPPEITIKTLDARNMPTKKVKKWEGTLRRDIRRSGLPCVEWQRPAFFNIDRNRLLLASGKYADEVGRVDEMVTAHSGSGSVAAEESSNGSPTAGNVRAAGKAAQTSGDAARTAQGNLDAGAAKASKTVAKGKAVEVDPAAVKAKGRVGPAAKAAKPGKKRPAEDHLLESPPAPAERRYPSRRGHDSSAPASGKKRTGL